LSKLLSGSPASFCVQLACAHILHFNAPDVLIALAHNVPHVCPCGTDCLVVNAGSPGAKQHAFFANDSPAIELVVTTLKLMMLKI
jgi:hypothetical protein